MDSESSSERKDELSHEQTLAILYDMAQTIGGEVNLRPLLTRTLQRLMAHTAFPVGLVLTDTKQTDAGLEATIEVAIGDYALVKHAGKTVTLAGCAMPRHAGAMDHPESLASLPTRKAYSACLHFPVENLGLVMLLSPVMPPRAEFMSRVFASVMANLSRAVMLCRSYEAANMELVSAHIQASVNTRRFRAALDHLSDAVILIDSGTRRIIDNNTGAERLFSYEKGALAGHSFALLFGGESEEGFSDALARLSRGETESEGFESRAERADGGVFPAEIRLNLMRERDGGELIIALVRDISERRRAEERLRLSASVFDNTHDGIIITDADQRILVVNPAFSRMTGYGRDEAIGRTPSLLASGRHDRAFYDEMWRALGEDGHWQGEIVNRRKNGELYTELLGISRVLDEKGEVSHYVSIFTDISKLKETQQRLEHLAHYDALTGLPNRVLLTDRLEQAMAESGRRGRALAVCQIDLDNMKAVNEAHGHEIGDLLLVEAGHRLQRAVREVDTVARLGGDEYAVLISDITDFDDVGHLLYRLLLKLAAPFRISGRVIEITASLGVTIFPEDDTSADDLLRHADQALYKAKGEGRNRFVLFDSAQERRAQERQTRIARVGQALAASELCLFYQPKVDMRAGSVVGMEALIRWRHPERGMVPPGEFIPLIEQSDLIVDVGEWTLREALRHQAQWRSQGLRFTVSVNIAARQLQLPDFTKRLRASLDAFPQVPPSALELEILESAALEDMGHMRRIMAECHELGVHFSLDDFGTGYSSLAYLKQLPARTIKIDQMFVRHMLDNTDDHALIEGIVTLAKVFEREVIAEGVETVEHGTLLMRLGCDLAQGYGIARPMPQEQVAQWVGDFRPDPKWRAWSAVSWSLDDFPLLVAERDHVEWVRRIVEAADKAQPPAAELDAGFGAGNGRFDRWRQGPGGLRYAGTREFGDLLAAHDKLHSVASRVLASCRSGDFAAAKGAVPALMETRDALVASLQVFERHAVSRVRV